MKKPKVSRSKKGAIFNILWILVENPKNLEYHRIQDIQALLVSEFGIVLERKTVIDYMEILIELDLDINISHIRNKGYFISNRAINNSQREILIDLVKNNRSFDNSYKNALTDFCSLDMSRKYRREKKGSEVEGEYDIVRNLEAINKAIELNRNITFTYLNFDRFGKLIDNKRVYDVMPKKVYYNNGMYLLYCTDKFWDTGLSGLRIKYMRNVKIGDKSSENIPMHSLINFTLKVEILEEWSIEFIDAYFTDYEIVTSKNKTFAYITAPFDVISDWYKIHGYYYRIEDDYLIKDLRLISEKIEKSFTLENDFVPTIRKSIIDYYYHHNNSKDCDSFVKGILKQLDFNVASEGYLLTLENDIRKCVKDGITEVISVYYIDNELCEFEENINNLKAVDSKNRYFVILFNDLTKKQYDTIVKCTGRSDFTNDLNRFSVKSETFFNKFIIIKF